MSTATSPRPIAASVNAMNTEPSPGGRSNPSVNSEEPLAVNATD